MAARNHVPLRLGGGRGMSDQERVLDHIHEPGGQSPPIVAAQIEAAIARRQRQGVNWKRPSPVCGRNSWAWSESVVTTIFSTSVAIPCWRCGSSAGSNHQPDVGSPCCNWPRGACAPSPTTSRRVPNRSRMSGPGCEPGSVVCCAPNRSFPHRTAVGARGCKVSRTRVPAPVDP